MADGRYPISLVERVYRLDRTTAWALLLSLPGGEAESERLGETDRETGPVYTDGEADIEARRWLVEALTDAEDHRHGSGHELIDRAEAAAAERARRRQAALEAVAQEREEDVPAWVYAAGMEVCGE